MTEAAASEGDDLSPAARRRGLRWTLVALGLVVLVLGVLWIQRKPIADDFIARSLAARDVRARYDLVQVGVRTQRIENLVLGDPVRPELFAKAVEIDLGYGAVQPRVVAVRVTGARLYGDARGGTLRLGELDKFRDSSSTAPFSLPDIDLRLSDSRIRLETDAGPMGMTIAGSGNLQSGFAGQLAALMNNAAMAGCVAPRLTAYLAIRLREGSPHVTGPVRAPALRCADGGVTLAALAAQIDLRLSPQLDHWTGSVKGAASAARAQGVTLAGPTLAGRFDGMAKATRGEATLGLAALRAGTLHTGTGSIRAAGSFGGGRMQAKGQGDVADLSGLSASGLASLRTAGSGTPVAPLVRRLADALAAAQRDNRTRFRFAASSAGNAGEATLSALDFTSGSGAHIRLSEGGRFDTRWPAQKDMSAWTLTGSLASEGGGLPVAALRLRAAPDGGVSGQLFAEPYVASGARLALEPVRFVASAGGVTRIFTALTLDGPLAGGSVRGLSLPVEATLRRNGALSVNPACAPLRFTSLRTGSLVIGRTNLRLCPTTSAGLLAVNNGRVAGGGTIRALRINGALGDNPMLLTADMARATLADGRFTLAHAKLLIGRSDTPIRLSAATLAGGSLRGGLGGTAGGIEGQIGAVPLLVRDGNARWSFVNSALALNGAITVIDAANPDRFNPLVSRDFRLTLANSRIDAQGLFVVPRTDAPVGRVVVTHDLGSGTGQADMVVDALRFDAATQPEDVTRLALGVVANARGTVTGRGQVRWTSRGVTSTGEFSTQGMNLAAAFGPVEGLSTTLRFTDLIGLVTAPGQVATVRSINPGIEVVDGVIRYQLLPNQQVGVEGGRWPFSGGELTLLPSVMDFGAERARNLTFRVLGMDAGAFINTMELDNISATGTFDGLLPMVFDAQGGRIVGGILVARQQGMPPLVIQHIEGLDVPCDRNRQGGTLAYVGQVSNENLGRFGRLAFDALKNLQYKCLTILMDGAIDGEIVTQVAFNGVNRGELSAVPKPIARQFIGLPFIFNIKISAPFRGLMNTAKSFVDPSYLIRSQLGDGFQPVKQNHLAVQPRESDTGVSGEKK
ncbi:intermembrane phospholipid transport protein YdbH family protein [Sphingobium subterraneum]|uniref:Dicarboxylate transport domain-containing protein n=1 Tax=Sphingobium subterraneum TaxID=627688 RepID=A0A841IZW9_9SPHN|nr:YdbH domain-containing protein [Sphingobium subterraneum]MBB6123964.1 hypothetical protein [Sphingobium subterraneum]